MKKKENKLIKILKYIKYNISKCRRCDKRGWGHGYHSTPDETHVCKKRIDYPGTLNWFCKNYEKMEK